MACPRCGGTVTTYALDGRSASTCEDCGYVGVPADHHPEPRPNETWQEALDRFRERHGEGSIETTTLTVGNRDYTVPRELARRVQAFTACQRAVIRELLREPDPGDPDRTYADIAEAAGVHASYVGDIVREHGDLVATIERNADDPLTGPARG